MHPSNKFLVHRGLATATDRHELHRIAAQGCIEIARSNAGMPRIIEDLIVLLDASPPKQIIREAVASRGFKSRPSKARTKRASPRPHTRPTPTPPR